MRIFVDTNIVLDVLQMREGFFEESLAVLEHIAQGKATGLLPAGNVSDIYYVIRKGGKAADAAKRDIVSLMTMLEICDTTRGDIKAALPLPMRDFEDAILASAAKREKADCIVTRNTKDFSGSPVRALSPTEFLDEATGGVHGRGE